MKVKQLIRLLQKQDPDRLVVLASDPEGNSHDTASDVYACAYDISERETGLEKLTPAHRKAGYTVEDIMAGTPAVVISP